MFIKHRALAVTTLINASSASYSDLETGKQAGFHLSNLITHQSPPNLIDFRLPPTFEEDKLSSWIPTPTNWFLGTWYFQYSSSPIHQRFLDTQWTLSPTDASPFDGTLHDLTTHSVLHSTSHIFQEYAIDVPTIIDGQPIPDSYTYIPTNVPGSGITLVNNTWSLIAWGYDGKGVPYAVVYEGPGNGVGPVLNIIRRDESSLPRATLELIYHGIKGLKNEVLDSAMASMKPTMQDGARNGELYPACNAACKTNENAFGIAPGTQTPQQAYPYQTSERG